MDSGAAFVDPHYRTSWLSLPEALTELELAGWPVNLAKQALHGALVRHFTTAASRAFRLPERPDRHHFAEHKWRHPDVIVWWRSEIIIPRRDRSIHPRVVIGTTPIEVSRGLVDDLIGGPIKRPTAQARAEWGLRVLYPPDGDAGDESTAEIERKLAALFKGRGWPGLTYTVVRMATGRHVRSTEPRTKSTK
jgi:hypothetical protein